MDKTKLRLCVSVMLVVFRLRAEAYYNTNRKILEPNPEHPGKCYSDVTKTAYDVKETWGQRGVCVQYECSQDVDGNFVITTHGCIDTSEFENDPYCWITEGDLSNPYPSCCPAVACA